MLYLLNSWHYTIYKENNVCILSGKLNNDKIIMRHKNWLAIIPVNIQNIKKFLILLSGNLINKKKPPFYATSKNR